MNYTDELTSYREKMFRILKEIEFFKGVTYNEDDDCQYLTIYGYWRIVKRVDSSGKIHHKAMRRSEENYLVWEDVPWLYEKKQLGIPTPEWPLKDIPLFSMKTDPSYVFFEVINQALIRTLLLCGFNHLFPGECPKPLHSRDDVPAPSIARASSGAVPWAHVYKHSLFGKAYAILKPKRAMHGKMFISLFWNKMVDRPLYRVANLSSPYIPTLNTYIGFSKNREPAVALLTEKPNLIPFLNFIPIDDWGNSDILASKHWIRSLKTKKKKKLSFISSASYKLIQRLAPDSVARICNLNDGLNEIPLFIDALVEAQIAKKIPAEFIKIISRYTCSTWASENRAFFPVFLRLAGREYLRLKGRRPFLTKAEKRDFVSSVDNIEDWFQNVHYNVPRNVTWQSLVRKGNEWHTLIREEAQQGYMKLEENVSTETSWIDPLGESEFEILSGIKVRPLVSPASLIEEGRVMYHCLGQSSWCRACQSGYMWCYSLSNPGASERSTVAIIDRDGEFQIVQHYGPYNDPPSEIMGAAASYLLGIFIKSAKVAM